MDPLKCQTSTATPAEPGGLSLTLDEKVIELDRKRERFRLRPFHELTIGSERAYLVKGLIPRVGLAVVWGPPKCGKSFWAFDLAMHVALGREYRGRRVCAGAGGLLRL